MSQEWPAAPALHTARLSLEPLCVDHADEMAGLLDDEGLHEFTGGHPATRDQLRERYARQAAGHSPDGSQGWLNWIVRLRDTGAAVGFVQATLECAHRRVSAELAWVVAGPFQGHGYAGEAAGAMAEWVREAGADVLVAHVHPDHRASIAVARRIGLDPTDVVVDGETRWTSLPEDPAAT